MRELAEERNMNKGETDTLDEIVKYQYATRKGLTVWPKVFFTDLFGHLYPRVRVKHIFNP
jgi:hypothetical protein